MFGKCVEAFPFWCFKFGTGDWEEVVGWLLVREGRLYCKHGERQ